MSQKQDLDWSWEELPKVFGLIGAEAIDPLDELLSDDIDYDSKVILSGGLTQIAERFPDQRDRCVEVLTRQLSNYDSHHVSVNGALVLGLFKLKALEAVPVMEAAYQAKKVDEMLVGSWAKVQVDLGLKQASDFTPEELSIHYTPEQEELMANINAYLVTRMNLLEQSPPELELPVNQDLFMFDKPPTFKGHSDQSGSKKSSAKSGFGTKTKPASKKSKKKKK